MVVDGVFSILLPDVMKSSIRPDIVRFVHSNLAKNSASTPTSARFIICIKSVFEKLDLVFGTLNKGFDQKKGFVLPRSKMMNLDLSRIIKEVKRRILNKNPLRNLSTLLRLNPYAKTARRMALLAEAQPVKAKKEKLD